MEGGKTEGNGEKVQGKVCKGEKGKQREREREERQKGTEKSAG